MNMREKTTSVYTFDELSDEAKDTAREWFRRGLEFDAEPVLEDAERMADILGINIRTKRATLGNGSTKMIQNIYYSVGDRDAGACYDGSYSYKKGSMRAM